MKDNNSITLNIPQHAAIVRGLVNRVEKLYPLRHDMTGKLDKWAADEIRSTIKLIRLAGKSRTIQFSL